MQTQLLALIQDPLWWFSAVIVSLVVNLLSNWVYDLIQSFLGDWYISRAATRAIDRASYESKISDLLTDPSLPRSLKVQGRYEFGFLILAPLLAISSYKVATLEHAYMLANQGTLTATVIYLFQTVAAIVFFLVLVRTFLQRKKIQSAIKRIQARI